MNASVYADDDSYNKFSGAYIGGSIGGINADSKSVEKYESEKSGYTNKNEPEGLKVGGLLGYNYVTSKNVLLGVEANYHFYGADDETTEKFNGEDSPSYLVQTNIKQKATLKARLGYVFNNDKTLAFLTGGYATAKVKTKFEALGSENDTETQWHEGYLVGGGVEHFVNEKLTAKVEYNYTDYNNEKINSIYDSKYHNRIDEHSVQVGLIYHFKK
jgi:outer membrane immunogenic protein